MSKELPLYDWANEDFRRNRRGLWERYERDRRWEILIYSGRSIDAKVDPGVDVTNDHDHREFKKMYQRGYLTGRALRDAERLFPNTKPENVRSHIRLQFGQL